MNGKTVSQADLDAILKLAPAELRPAITKNPQELLRYYGFVQRLAEMAEKEGLANQSPLRERLAPDADFDALAAMYPVRDFANVIGKADPKISEAIRSAVFALRPGAVTKPIALANGVYLFLLEGIDVPPLESVRGQLSQHLANERFLQWMADIRKSVTVESSPRQ